MADDPRRFPRAPGPSRLALALSLALLATLALPAAAATYTEGQTIELKGVVTDPAGTPMAGLHVVLEAARTGFSLHHFKREKKETVRVSGVTNERGEYSLEWPWSRYYNSFELLVGVPIRKSDGERLKILERRDLGQRIKHGSPVVVSVAVVDHAYVSSLRAFLTSIESEDQRQAHQQMGEPDKVERIDYPDHREITWWYFESGKAYRFRDGKLAKIDAFAPIKEP